MRPHEMLLALMGLKSIAKTNRVDRISQDRIFNLRNPVAPVSLLLIIFDKLSPVARFIWRLSLIVRLPVYRESQAMFVRA